jgi:Cellulose biosynthesis protein BcsS
MKKTHYVTCILPVLLCGAVAAHAAETLVLTGVSGSKNSNYSYLGAVIANEKLADEGLRFKAWAAYLDYDYSILKTTNVNVHGPVLDAAVGYMWALPSTQISAYLGGVYRDMSSDNKSAQLNERFGVKLQGEIDHHFTSEFGMAAIASYTSNFDDYWTNFKPYYALSNNVRVGPELTLSGSPEYKSQRYGAFVEGISLGKLNLGANIGSEHNQTVGGNQLYGGISAAFVF